MKPVLLLFGLSVLGIFCLANGSWPPACSVNPCKNNGVCVPSSIGYYCRCTGPYSGRLCETVINSCLSNPCLGGGTCAVGSQNRHWYCICPPGKTGLRCEKVIHDCSSQPCQNGGSCCENQNGYTCDCKPGFTGNHCETDIDECLSEPCQNGGTCEDQVNGYRCTCRVGLAGRHCERKKPGCLSTTCLNGGSCAEASDGMWYCVCPKTYKGIQCEQRVNDCSSHPCQNGGRCCDKGDHYKCTCADGFTGKHCETKVPPCPCQNGGNCSSYNPVPSCSCPYPFTGRYCETHYCDIQEPCANGGTCVKIPNGYKCICPLPFTGNRCGQVMSTLPVTSSPGLISPSSPSSVSPPSSACNCVPGQGRCVGGTCLCNFSFKGPRCEIEINLCTENICGPSMSCSRIHGDWYTCISTPIYTTSITTSSPTPSATIIHDHICDISFPCGKNGQCIKLQTSPGYRCQCYPGYIGQHCQSSAPLTPTPALTSTASSSICNCVRDQGWCDGYKCVCHYSFYGPRCEFEHNACTRDNVCGSTAVCSKISGDQYTCISSSILTPTPPLTSTSSASSCHCLHGGTCQSNGQCYCPIGFGGPNCGYYTDYCLRNPCKNGGYCHEQREGYSCSCRPGFSGSICESGNSPTTIFRTPHFQETSSATTTRVTTPRYLMSTVSTAVMMNKRSKRDIIKNEISDVEDKELKRICKINELKAKKFFNDKRLPQKNWKNLHPGIKAVLVDLVANNDHRKLSGTHEQIKKAVLGNDLMKMSQIMSKRSLWKRVPVARYWKRKQMMKKAVKNPLLVDSQGVC